MRLKAAILVFCAGAALVSWSCFHVPYEDEFCLGFAAAVGAEPDLEGVLPCDGIHGDRIRLDIDGDVSVRLAVDVGEGYAPPAFQEQAIAVHTRVNDGEWVGADSCQCSVTFEGGDDSLIEDHMDCGSAYLYFAEAGQLQLEVDAGDSCEGGVPYRLWLRSEDPDDDGDDISNPLVERGVGMLHDGNGGDDDDTAPAPLCDAAASLGGCDAIDTYPIDGAGFTNQIGDYSCNGAKPVYNGPEQAYSWTAPFTGAFQVRLSGTTENLAVFVLRNVDGECDPQDCFTFSDVPGIGEEFVSFEAAGGDEFFFVVDSRFGATTSFTIETSCG